MKPYRIVLADDHALLRQGLRRILEEESEFKVVGEAGDGLELLDLLNNVKADMVILDVSMPNLEGTKAAARIRETHPDMKVMVLTMHGEVEFLSRAMAAGVDGYVLKENCDTDLFDAIHKIRKGKMYISPCMSDAVLDRWLRSQRGEGVSPGATEELSGREGEIMKLLAEGKSNKEIASETGLSVRTVEYHRAKLMKKLNLKSVADLIKYAIQKRYTS